MQKTMQEIKVPNRYFFQVENLYDELGLDVYEYRLLMHYLRRGNCFESIETTAKICAMSRKRAQAARDTLEEKGLIRTTRKDGFKTTITIEVIDIQTDNTLYFASGTIQNPALAQLVEKAKKPRKTTIGRFVTDVKVTDVKRPTKNTTNKNTKIKEEKPLVANATGLIESESDSETKSQEYVLHPTIAIKREYESLLGRSLIHTDWIRGNGTAAKSIGEKYSVEQLREAYQHYKREPFWKDKVLSLSYLEKLMHEYFRNRTGNELSNEEQTRIAIRERLAKKEKNNDTNN
jgi:hypothetical protein